MGIEEFLKSMYCGQYNFEFLEEENSQEIRRSSYQEEAIDAEFTEELEREL